MAAFKVQKRESKGKYTAFDLRKKGFIPGVVYSKDGNNQNISINLKEFRLLLKSGERIIDLDIDGTLQKAMVKAVQHGTYDHEILHADFRPISENESIEVEVEIVVAGEAPGVAAGGMLEQNLHHVLVRCLPKDIPARIAVNVDAMQIGDIIYAKDLPAIAGVAYFFHGNPAVVSCHHPKGETEAAPAAEGEAPTAPEVIGEKEREAKAKEEGEKKK